MARDLAAGLVDLGVRAVRVLQSSNARTTDNVLGISCMLAAMGFFVVGDAVMKVMSMRLPTGETMFIRGVIAVALVWSLVMATGALPDVKNHLRWPLAWRTGADAGAAVCFQTGLSRLPFAETGAILQINPLLVTAAAAVFLGEKVGWRRWSATAVGLCGVLLIIRPGAMTFHWASLVLLMAACFSTARDLITRQLRTGTSTLVITAFTITAVWLASLLFIPFEPPWRLPTIGDVAMLAIPATFMLIGQVLVVISIRSGEVSAVVPYRYSAILWTLTLSFLVWREIPDRWTLLGIAIVCSAGLYTFHREQVRRREAAAAARARAGDETP